MLPAITLRQMRFLVAVADELNFSRAAKVCSVTQPTLSTGLKELEDRLGVILAERTKRSVILTPAGAEIAARARAVLLSVREIEDLAARRAGSDVGDLRLGAIPTIGPFLVPRALPAIRKAFPDLRLLLREEMTEKLLEGLHDGHLDLILFALPFEATGIETMPLFDDGYHLAAMPGSLSKTPVKGSELDGTRLMLLERGHCLQRHALSAFPDRNIQQDDSFSATSLSTLISMVSEGVGITLLPDLAIDAGVLSGQKIDIAPLPDACPRRVVLAWRTTSSRADLFRKLGEILRETRTQIHRGPEHP
ncbi:hydrogen peroxide-inducible genes activator [Labrenzia sp. 011]|uniref:hydrogen peroxide-inducible genes activator n=1 Tax=Labrenzia sp. 011 TaxID=2171494 RepID=UPI000D518202|nr:hydrogen peroxide-inducible genes activator [Labrenzia sp. 011]PVB60950.1 LysR family transcriptional regulator [Labrenzia sp. 011]